MKKLLILVLFIVSFVFSFGQSISNRSNGSLTVQDDRWAAKHNAFLPRYADTATANTQIGIDSCGAIIYTYSNDFFWIRQCFPVKHWSLIQNGGSSSLLPTCGLKNGTGLITWDSLLTFDVTAALYAQCCDNITRTTASTTITLDSNDADDPRIDLIILDSNGVNSIKGTPAANPSTPQTDSCQIILTYVLIRAHDTVPAVITPTNPLVIYDENYYFNDSTEFVLDTSANFGSIDTADLSNPVHLLHDLKITNPSSANSFKFQSVATFDLNDYGALKLYVQKSQAASFTLQVTFYLDSVQQTLPVQVVSANGGANTYATIIIPIANIRYINTSQFNQIKFQISPAQTGTFYFDWIQLQMGFPIVNTSNPPTVSANNLNPVFNTTVTGGSNLNFTQQNALPYSVLGNTAASAGMYAWVKVNLGTMIDSLLGVQNLFGGNSGDVLKNVNNVWTPVADTTEIDTVFAYNWISVYRGIRDTLAFGSRDVDSSLLSFDTYAGLNGHSLFITDATFGQMLVIDQTNFFSVLNSTNGSASSYFEGDADFTNNNVVAKLVSTNGIGTTVSLLVNSFTNRIISNADTLDFHSTLSGASTGYVWTLKDPTTGSGYWAVGGGGGHPTLQEVFNNEVGGSVLTKRDSILSSSHEIYIISNLGNANLGDIGDGSLFYAAGNISGEVGFGAVVGGSVLNGQSFGDAAIQVSNLVTTPTIIAGNAAGGLIESLITYGVNNNDVVSSVAIYRSTDIGGSTLPSNGVGTSINLILPTNNSSVLSADTATRLISIMTDVTQATRTSQFVVKNLFSGSTVTSFTANGDGSWQIRPITATAASAITPAEGMIVFVSNTNGTFLSVGFWGYQGGLWIKM